MTTVYIRYDSETERVFQTYWGETPPKWASDPPEGAVDTTQLSQSDREAAIRDALNSVEAGVDYDANTEVPISKLCYDPNADKLYGEVKIQPLRDES